ncbi:AEC family transporter [Alkalibacterium iburiense]|uniref:AEC family transporter n=1 Tax=Alkalibacterium iburiense TaxID=290589 RepID=A0ABN0X826_9LACT
MEISIVIVEQLLQMAIILLFGFILVKFDFLKSTGSQQLANIVTKFVIPIVLMLSFQRDYDGNQLILLGTALLGSLLIVLSRIIVAHILIKKKLKIDRYAVVFSNTAFMGIPIILPLLGYEGIFYLSMYIVTSGIAQFTYGIWILSEGKHPMTLRNVLTNPASIGAFIGFILYIIRIPLPPILYNGLDTIAGLSSPLGMILLGGYLARSRFKEIFLIKHNYWVVCIRLIIAPLVGLLILWLSPITDSSVLLVLTIANCTPTAVNTALFSQIYGGDYEYGARIIILASIFSIITMPLIISLSSLVLPI